MLVILRMLYALGLQLPPLDGWFSVERFYFIKYNLIINNIEIKIFNKWIGMRPELLA